MTAATGPTPAARPRGSSLFGRGATSVTDLDYRPSYLAAAITSALVFLLYLITLGPSTAMWDTSEYMAAAYTMSFPHPPGNPFFVLIGRVFSILPIAPTVAQRINVLAALSSAVAAGMWFLITERVLVGWLPQRWQRVTGGALAALLSATAFTVWSQSVVNEKVYTVSLAGVALIAWLTVRWCDDPDGPRADRLLVLVSFLLGLGYANHMAGILAAPAVAVAVLGRRPRTLLRWRLLAACIGAVILGASPFAMQPIRAAHYPPLNTGEVTGCANGLAIDCTFSRTTLDRFLYNFNREQYAKPSLSQRQAPFTAQVGMWWIYFKWQWLRDVEGTRPLAQHLLAFFFLSLGLIGGWVHWKYDRRSFWFFGPLIFTMTLGLIYYLNFKLGWTQAQQMGISPSMQNAEVRDRDYFYLWSFSSWCVWASLGLVWVWQTLAGMGAVSNGRVTSEGRRAAGDTKKAQSAERGAPEAARDPRAATLPTRRWLLASPVLALALIPLFANWRAASRASDTFTRDWAHDMLNSVEPYGILITHGDNDTFPLWYAQEVEGIRRDVTVAVTSYLNTDWYARQIIRRPVYEYDAAKGPAIYRGRAWPKPTRPALAMTLDEADSIPEFVQLAEAQVFEKDSIRATIPAGYLTRDQILVLRFIKDSFPERPIYFSAGGYERALGFGDYVVTQGVLTRIMPTRVVESAGTKRIQSEWMDVPRTKALWDSVYAGPRSMIALGKWTDRASESIPLQYVITGALLADALAQLGDEASAKRITETAFAVARAAGLERVFAPQLLPSGGDTATR